MPDSALEWAYQYYDLGFAPIPVPKGKKNPNRKEWQKERWTREELPDQFNDCNVGLLLGEPSHGLVEVDLDCEKARRIADYILPQTAMTSGRDSSPKSHRWYHCDPQVETAQYQDPEATGDRAMILEVRSTGGQTEVAPSLHPSGEYYKWYGELNPAKVNGNVLLFRGRKLAACALIARHWIHGKRHNTALALAGYLLSRGWSVAQVETLIRLAAAAALDEDVEDRVKTAQTTRERLDGGENATGLPRLVELIGDRVVKQFAKWLELGAGKNESEPDHQKTVMLVHADDLDKLPRVEYLIWEKIPRRGLSVLFGPSGCGKSFYALDCALTVAQEHNVVYVAAEGISGYSARKSSWCSFHNSGAGGLYFYLDALIMLSVKAIDSFILAIAEISPALVVIDTLSRCMAGGDENSAKDMSLLIEACDQIQKKNGAAVLLVHHTGRNGTHERGSTALRGAADSMIEMTNDDGLITIACSKSKDGRPFDSYQLRLIEHAESCVLLPAEQVFVSDQLTPNERRILETLAWDIFIETGASAARLVEITRMNERTVWRGLDSLKRKNYVCQDRPRGPYKLTNEGRQAAKSCQNTTEKETFSNDDVGGCSDSSDNEVTSDNDASHTDLTLLTHPFRGVRMSGCQSEGETKQPKSSNNHEPPRPAGPRPLREIIRDVRSAEDNAATDVTVASVRGVSHEAALEAMDNFGESI